MAITNVNVHAYHPLGNKTLFMLIFKRSLVFVLFLPILLVGLFFLSYVPNEYFTIATNIIFGYGALMLITFIAIFLVAWLEYIHYGIFVDEKNLKITKGIIAEETTGIPYRRIKNVKIERSLIDQLFGMSDIIIESIEAEEGRFKNYSERDVDDVIFLPSLEKSTALHIQDVILKRAQVEQINVVSSNDNILNKTNKDAPV